MSAMSPDRDAQIIDQYRSGTTMAEIAATHGLSAERVRQIVRRGGEPGRSTRSRPSGEKVRLRIGNMAKAVLVTGQAYQDPKDALNEFVSNAADDYAETGRRGERIRVVLRRKGRIPVVMIDDCGRGMSPDRLREVARNLFESTKAGDDRTLGEKAIGLLGFQQLGARCEIVSMAEGSDETWTLLLERGRADAHLARERRRTRSEPGTTVYLSHLDPEVLRMLTHRKVVDYLRRRRGPALARGDYVLEVVEGKTAELVTPEEPEGVRLAIPPSHTLWGRIEFVLHVAPERGEHRQVAVVGRAGTVILDSLTELEEFEHAPWTSGHLSGRIVFEALQQSAGRRAVLRDRDAFPIFRETVLAVEGLVAKTIERLRQEVDQTTADRLSDTVRKVFGRVLKELADLENPMRTPLGDHEGEGALMLEGELDGDVGAEPEPAARRDSPGGSPTDRTDGDVPPIGDLLPESGPPPLAPGGEARPAGSRSRHLPTVSPDPTPGPGRSRFEPDDGVVFYNERHPDFLLVKETEQELLDYLATLVAKEYVVYNNPLASADDLGEEMVRMLIRVRRHLPRSRR
jgi:hypothetical protein